MSKKQPRNTKGKIISAAWKLFYEQGYDDTTIDEIIAEEQKQFDAWLVVQ